MGKILDLVTTIDLIGVESESVVDQDKDDNIVWSKKDERIDRLLLDDQRIQRNSQIMVYEVHKKEGATLHGMTMVVLNSYGQTMSTDNLLRRLKVGGSLLTLPTIELLIERRYLGECTSPGFNESINFAFVEEKSGNVSALCAYSRNGGWGADLLQIRSASLWRKGCRLLVRKPIEFLMI